MKIGSEQTVKCPICGDLYKFFAHYAGDQSACPKCVQKAATNMNRTYYSAGSDG